MPDAVKMQTMARFAGINNIDDPTRLNPAIMDHEYVYPLVEANNVEIDNTAALSSRPCYDDVLAGTDMHSLWADGDVCLFVDGTSLKSVTPEYTTTTLATVTKGARMSYASMNDRIYYTNGYEIGYVRNNTAVAIPIPTENFKQALPAGQLIEYYRGCLYVAKRNILYIGDDRIWWVNGKSGDQFTRDEVYPSVPIIYTDLRVNGQYIGPGIKGNVALWTCENGICMGDNGGQVVNLTESRYLLSPAARGASFIRENSNVRHYINSLY